MHGRVSLLDPGPLDPGQQLRDLIARRGAAGGTAVVEGASGRSLGWAGVAQRSAGWIAAAPAIGTRAVPPVAGPASDLPPVARPASDLVPVDGTARVGLLISDPLEMAGAFLAALAAGITVAPLNPAGTTRELVSAARTLGLAAVVGGAAELDVHGAALGRSGTDLWAADPSGPALVARRGGDAVTGAGGGAALLLSSSGTTGPPKLIPLGLGGLVHTARSVVSHHQLEPSDCGYSPLPLFHINGLVVGVLAALLGGHRLVVDRRFSATTFWDVVDDNAVTWLNLVPAVIAVLAGRPAPDPRRTARVAFARSASAPLPVATLERFERATGVVVLETYGMTEAGSQITANPRPPASRRPGSVGVPVGIQLRIVDGDRRALAAGLVGGVEIRGASVVAEYWAPAGTSPAARPACDPDGWLPTGDLGRCDADGFVHLLGRDDDVINRGGEKVYPLEVEEVLFADDGVAAAAVVGRSHPIVGEEPVAFVVAGDGVDGDALRVRLAERCREELSRFRRPVEILLVDALPSGLNGKVRRMDLRLMVAASAPDASGVAG